MKILGLGGSTHDYSCCLLENGKIVRAIEEERLSKEKHGTGVRSILMQCIEYCIRETKLEDISYIVTNDILEYGYQLDKNILNNIIKINHHVSHASSAYFTSGMEEASILVLDGSGSHFREKVRETISCETCSIGYAKNTNIDLQEKLLGKDECYFVRDLVSGIEKKTYFTNNSISSLYEHLSYACGFGSFGEGKTMGLSAYGKDTYLRDIYKYISFSTNKLDFHVDYLGLQNFIYSLYQDSNVDRFTLQADIAYAAQFIFEKYVLNLLNVLYSKTHCENLCFAGGAALNSVLNGKIKKYTPFKNVYVFPAAGDSGTAIGAALYTYYKIDKINKTYKPEKMSNCFFGIKYSDKIIEDALIANENKITHKKMEFSSLCEYVADELRKDKIVGWYQDGCEFGPRALGNRSILAFPHNKDMKDIINQRVKFRENFRPFAPVVKEEFLDEYFLSDIKNNPYMLFVGKVKEDKKHLIPAVTHVDGTARLQTVNKKENNKLYQLLDNLQRLTGIPILLNTSFNIKGRPIVETPGDALSAFIECDMDLLVIGNYIVTKTKSI